MRVLLIEDDPGVAQLIHTVLTRLHITIDQADNGRRGLELARQGIYDVIILDWMLPGQDGLTICRAIRDAELPVGILMLTARATVGDRVSGLDSGADDYLVKPFALPELRARVQALGRRAGGPRGQGGGELRAGDLVLDLAAHRARYGPHVLDLSPTEWTLLELLIRHRGQALSRQQILDYVWPLEATIEPSLVDVNISRLRRKLWGPQQPDLIETVRGIGYRLRGE